MPLYTFGCDHCEQRWDEYLCMDDCRKPLEEPHDCGGEVYRVYTPAMVISDDLGFSGVVNPCDGKSYDSRSEYYKTLKKHGCEVMDSEPDFKTKEYVPRGLKEDIAQAYKQHS